MIQAVILDIDGTLLDSNDSHAQSWHRIFRNAGFDFPIATIRSLIGSGNDKMLEFLISGTSQAERERLSEKKKQLFLSDYFPKLRPFPSTLELLKRMRDGGLRLAIATSASPDEARPMLKLVDPDQELEFILSSPSSGADHGVSKPGPGPVNLALKTLKCEPTQALMLGDTPYDLESAERAGVKMVALQCGGWSKEAFDGALAVYKNPRELLEYYDESPFFIEHEIGGQLSEVGRMSHSVDGISDGDAVSNEAMQVPDRGSKQKNFE